MVAVNVNTKKGTHMYTKPQRTAAIIGLILILLFLIGLVLSAIFNPGGKLFYGMLFGTIALPILLWIYIWLYGKMSGKHTIADFDLPGDKAPAQNAEASYNAAHENMTVSKKNIKDVTKGEES